MELLPDQTAVITGAGSGIGRALALKAAAEGMHVVLADIEEPPLRETAELIAGQQTGTATQTLCVPTDVSSAQSVAELADAAFGWHGNGVQLLCNNAGVFVGGLMWERTLADWDWVMSVNLWGLIHAVDAFVPRMLAQGGPGHIVNTASMGGLVSASFSGPYFTSKFAAVGLSECLAHDLQAVGAELGVSVLVPSLINTNIGTSGRNRPESFTNPASHEPASSGADIEQVLQVSTTEGGLNPELVAEQVFAAVRAGQFYIPTNDTYPTQLTMRHEDQQLKQLPRVPPID